MSTVPENFCPLPFVSLEARTDGAISPCCILQDSAPENLADGASMIDVWNGDWINSYRQAFLNNQKPKACNNCWMEEKSGIQSKRLRELEFYKDRYDFNSLEPTATPITMDLKLGNICNTKCRICTSFASSLWAKEESAKGEGYKQSALEFNRRGLWPKTNEVFWHEIDTLLPSIQKFEFFGGEPLLITRHFDILQTCVDKGYAKDIEISYNTNGSIYPEQYMSLYKHFKKVQFFFSIDGEGAEFDYLRYPNKFDDVLHNLTKFVEFANTHEHVEINLFQTISVLNMCTLENFTNYCNKNLPMYIHYNMVFEPKHMSPKVLPKKIKKQISYKYIDAPEYVKRIVNFMNSEDYDISEYEKFISSTKFSDNYRNESFPDTFPELHNLIKDDWNSNEGI